MNSKETCISLETQGHWSDGWLLGKSFTVLGSSCVDMVTNELSGLLSLIVLEVPAYKWKPIEDKYYYNIIIWAQTAKYPTFNCNVTMARDGLIWYRGGEGLGNGCRQLPSLVKHSFVHPQLHVIICLKHYIQAWSASRAYSYICNNAAISNHHFEYCTS